VPSSFEDGPVKGVGCFLLGLGLVLLAGCGGGSGPAVRTEQYNVNFLERELYELTNEARAQENVAPCNLDLNLCKIARAHAEGLSKGGVMMAPDKDKLQKDLRAARYDYEIWGTTVNKFEVGRLGFAFNGLLTKPQTKDEILKPEYVDVGVGVAANEGNTEFFLTQVFAKRNSGK
jgi:uncharacterized protein YkwD